MDIKISPSIMLAPWDDWRVQNTVWQRRQLGLEGYPNVRVHQDNGWKSPWKTAELCHYDFLSTGATHHLLLQDDVVWHPGAIGQLERAVEAHPDKFKEAGEAGMSWLTGKATWGTVTCWPEPLLREFLAWEREWIRPDSKHDDGRYDCFLHWAGVDSWITAPTLFEHAEVRSTLGHVTPLPSSKRSSWVWRPDLNGEVDWSTEPMSTGWRQSTPSSKRQIKPEKWEQFVAKTS